MMAALAQVVTTTSPSQNLDLCSFVEFWELPLVQDLGDDRWTHVKIVTLAHKSISRASKIAPSLPQNARHARITSHASVTLSVLLTFIFTTSKFLLSHHPHLHL